MYKVNRLRISVAMMYPQDLTLLSQHYLII